MAKLADAARAYGNHGEKSEQKLEVDVRQFLTDYADVEFAARLIISSYWEPATPEQRDRFLEAFNNQVTNLLVNFVPDIDFKSVRIDPFSGDIEETPFIIRATFQTSDKQIVHFDLVIHERYGRWLIFDVSAEGVSYVKTYRHQFSGEISDSGLDATIDRFEFRSITRGNH